MKILAPDYLNAGQRKKIEGAVKGVSVDYFKVEKRKRLLFVDNGFELVINNSEVRKIFDGASGVLLPTYFNKAMTSFLVSMLPDLRWIHTTKTGADNIIIDSLKDRIITITNTHICSDSIAEYVMALILCVTKRFHLHLRFQQRGIYKFISSDRICKKRVGILGMGRIGKTIATRLKVNGAEVLGWDKSDKGNPPLKEFLSRCDFVVVTLPLTLKTAGLISHNEISAMRKDAWIINVGRGEIIDGKALYKCLLKKKIGGACLDLLDEYLIRNSKRLGKLDNVILTHHSSFYYPDYNNEALECFIEELNSFARNQPLSNIVNVDEGY